MNGTTPAANRVAGTSAMRHLEQPIALPVLHGVARLVGGDPDRGQARPPVVLGGKDQPLIDGVVMVRQVAPGLRDLDIGYPRLGHDGLGRLAAGDPPAR